MPSRSVLVLLLAVATLPPLVAQATGSVVGSFTMFNRLARYHVELVATEPGSDGAGGANSTPVGGGAVPSEVRVSLHSLASHLSREARVILLPADGDAVGADQVDVVIAALPDLARLVCELRPRAQRVEATLRQDPFDARLETERRATVTCQGVQ